MSAAPRTRALPNPCARGLCYKAFLEYLFYLRPLLSNSPRAQDNKWRRCLQERVWWAWRHVALGDVLRLSKTERGTCKHASIRQRPGHIAPYRVSASSDTCVDRLIGPPTAVWLPMWLSTPRSRTSASALTLQCAHMPLRDASGCV
jgi:hypothetical protein